MAVADVVQTTAASQPLLLAHSGVNYWWGSGVAGNCCSTADNVANEITGDIEIIVKASFQDWKISTNNTFVSKWNATLANISYGFSINSGKLGFFYSTTGVYELLNDVSSSASVSFSANQIGWVKANLSASTHTVKFYTSTDGITYNQLGTDINSLGTSIYNSNQQLSIGQSNDVNYYFPLLGKIYRATISDTIGGAPVVDFNPSEYSAASSQTDWNSSTGEVWTINVDSGNTGYKGVLVNRTVIQTDGIDDLLEVSLSTFSGNDIPLTMYSSGNIFSQNYNTLFLLCKTGSNIPYTGAGRLNGSNVLYFTKREDAAGANELYATENMNYLLLYTLSMSGNTIFGYLNNVSKGSNTLNLGQTTLDRLTIPSVSPFNKGQVLYTTGIITSLSDSSTQRTAMYNITRSMNNNAF